MDAPQIEINEISGYWTFLKSIDWKDPWLIGLVAFHIMTTTMALMTRNHSNVQMGLFLVLLSAAYFSESINKFAADNWHTFSKQQYFDSNGLFISTVFSIPILLNCMLLIGAWLYSSTQLMSKLATARLQEKVKLQREAAASESTEANTHLKAD